jgi:hypothetical protein
VWVREVCRAWKCEQMSFHSRNARLEDNISFYQDRTALEKPCSTESVFIKTNEIKFWKYEPEILINFKKKEILTLNNV